MDKEKLKRAADIGDETGALEGEAGPEREALIEKLCAGDPELVQFVREYISWSEDEAPDEHPDEPFIRHLGKRIGPWILTKVLGSGGFGVVFLAERKGPVQRAAIKLLQGTIPSRDSAARFRQEQRALAKLNHPYIVQLKDVGITEDGQRYFVMDYVEGARPIDAYCRENKLTTRQKIELFQKVCDAVSSAHQNLILHRDLKPGNILVAKDGTPKLVDFNLAKPLDPLDQADGVSSRAGMGTQLYMSPEQARGQDVKTTTDVYSLGVVLYELLTGTDPYNFESRMQVAAEKIICEVDPELPSRAVRRSSVNKSGKVGEIVRSDLNQLGRVLAGDIDTILMVALRKEPERRYQSVEQFRDDLRHHLQLEPLTAVPDSTLYRTKRFLRRNNLRVSAALTILLSLVIAVIVVSYEAHNETVAKDDALKAKGDAIRSAAYARGQEALATSRLAEATAARQEADRQADSATRAQKHAEDQTFLAEDRALSIQASLVGERLRREPVAGLSLAIQTAAESLRQFHRLTPDVLRTVKAALDSSLQQTTLSSSGPFTVRTLMFGPDDNTLFGASGLHRPAYTYRWQLDGKRVRDVQQEFPYPKQMSPEDLIVLSPAGDQVLSGDRLGNLAIWDRSRGFLRDPWKAHDGPIVAVAFSADGRLIASAGQDKIIRIWDAGGKPLGASQPNATPITAIAFSRDSSHSFIAAGGQDGTVSVWKTADGTLVEEPLRGHQDAVRVVQFSEHMEIASGDDDGAIRLWLPTFQKGGRYKWSSLAPLRGHATGITAVAFRADGYQVASGSRDGMVRLWDDHGRELSVLKGHHAPITALAFCHSGRLLASAADQFPDLDNTVRLWDLEGTLEQATQISESFRDFAAMVFSPDGNMIAIATSPATPNLESGELSKDDIRVWTTNGEAIGTRFRGHTGHITAVAFSSDSKLLVTGCDDATIRIWTINGKLLHQVVGHFGAVTALGIHLNTILVAGRDNRLHLLTLDGHESKSWTISASGNTDRVIISNSGNLVAVVICNNCANRSIRTTSPTSDEPRGEAAAELNRHDLLRLYDWQGNLLSREHEFKGHITAVGFSRDETYTAASVFGFDSILWLNDNSSRRERTFEVEMKAVDLGFSPDSQTVWTMDRDGRIAFWGLEGERLGQQQPSTIPVNMLKMAFSPVGGLLATVDQWGHVFLYRSNWLLRACDRLHDFLAEDLSHDALRIPLIERTKVISFCEAYTNENTRQ